jgi:small subunit ribosomal protein S16
MSVRIRLTRTGRKNEPAWRIAVFDSRTRRDGRYLENLGTYEPQAKKADEKVKLNRERFDHWLSKGALPTDSLERLLKHCGQLAAKK